VKPQADTACLKVSSQDSFATLLDCYPDCSPAWKATILNSMNLNSMNLNSKTLPSIPD
jgi:hypothetical protein